MLPGYLLKRKTRPNAAGRGLAGVCLVFQGFFELRRSPRTRVRGCDGRCEKSCSKLRTRNSEIDHGMSASARNWHVPAVFFQHVPTRLDGLSIPPVSRDARRSAPPTPFFKIASPTADDRSSGFHNPFPGGSLGGSGGLGGSAQDSQFGRRVLAASRPRHPTKPKKSNSTLSLLLRPVRFVLFTRATRPRTRERSRNRQAQPAALSQLTPACHDEAVNQRPRVANVKRVAIPVKGNEVGRKFTVTPFAAGGPTDRARPGSVPSDSREPR